MTEMLKKAAPFIPIVQEYATKYQVPPELMLSILAQESAFNPVAVGPMTRYGTAKGIAQFIDPTAKRFGVDPMNPRSAIEGQAKYLSLLGKMFNNDPRLMAAAYNAGEGAVQKAKGVPNFPETQNYVQKVLEFMPMFMNDPETANMAAKQVDLQSGNPLGGLSNILAGINPQTLVPEQQATMSGPLRTLLTTLATIGNLGGVTANIISAAKGNPATGNEAIRQSGDLFGRIQKDQQAQQQQRDIAALASNPDLNPLLQAIAAIGGRDALTSVAMSAAKEALPANQLAMLRAQQEYEQNTTAGRARLAEEKRMEAVATAKALQPFKGIGEERAATSTAMALRKEMSNLPDIKAAREVLTQFSRVGTVYQNYLKNPGSRATVDQVLINGINKMIDPQSVVREGEYARSEEGVAYLNKLASYKEKFSKGGVSITDSDRADIYNTIKLLQEGHTKAIAPTIDFYKKEAVRSGVDPERVLNLKIPSGEDITPKTKTYRDYSVEELNSMSLEELRKLVDGD